VNNTEKIFTSYDIQACLYDEVRVGYFRDAIQRTVRPGDVVVDAGSGTGLLGMLAAKAGAAKVFCVEINKEFIQLIEENAGRNGLADRIIAIHGDATTIKLPEPVDVIVCEAISAGFFYEPQLQILRNLRPQLKTGGTIIPFAMENRIELIDAQEQLYGLTFNYDTRFKGLNDVALTNKCAYLKTDFGQPHATFIGATVPLRIVASGRANAVRISYAIDFAPGIFADQPTDFLLNPQIIFLPDPIAVIEGDEIEISLAYEASASPLDCKIEVRLPAANSGGSGKANQEMSVSSTLTPLLSSIRQ
jgi:predicted RNA methylase